MTTSGRGALSEAEVILCLARLGASVWAPVVGHDHRFDLIAYFNGTTSRIQVKTMRDVVDDGRAGGSDGAIMMSGQTVAARGKRWPVITKADCDIIVGWHPEMHQAYAIRPEGKTKYTFRRTPAKNNQIIGVWFEVDFRLTNLAQLVP